MTLDADIKGSGVPMIHVHIDGTETTQDAADAIIRAMEGQRPNFNNGLLSCPACGYRVFNKNTDAYCGHCGQKILWEE